MGITKSGINPQEVLSLITRIDDIKKRMNAVYTKIDTSTRDRMNRAYGGEAATALMTNTTKLMKNCEEELDSIVKMMASNMNGDLDDAKATDQNLAG